MKGAIVVMALAPLQPFPGFDSPFFLGFRKSPPIGGLFLPCKFGFIIGSLSK